MHQRPVAGDVGRFPRRRRRQRGGRGHQLRLSLRQHARLDDGLRRAPGPIQDDDRRNGDAGCKRDSERAACASGPDALLWRRRDRGAVPSGQPSTTGRSSSATARVLRLAVTALLRLRGAGRRLLLPLALLLPPSPSRLVDRRRRLGLRRPKERDQLRDALFRSSPGVARPARAVLGLGDEGRRRVAKDVVPVRTAFLRKPDRGLVAAFGVLMSVMIVGVFSHSLGRDQTDMRVHRASLPSEIMSSEGGGARREDRTEKWRPQPRGRRSACRSLTARDYLIETFDRNITPTETFAAR